MVVAVIVGHQRPHTNRTARSTEPLRLPRRGGHGSTLTPSWRATGAKLGCTWRVPGTITVASRSVRHTLAVPPNRRSTPSIASTRWGWSTAPVSIPRTRPE